MINHENLYMGIDIGTSGCKAAVFDEAGGMVSSAYREYDVKTPQAGWAELDSDEVIQSCFDVIKESSTAAEPPCIRAIGICSQGEAFTPIDAGGKTLCGALVSSDTRASTLAESWPHEFGLDKLYRITGHTAHPMFSLFKLLWIRKNHPNIWGRAAKFLCFEDLLEYRLGLDDPAIGWPLAGRTMLFDVTRHEWSDELLNAIGLSKNQLARPLRSGSAAGTIGATAAAELGLAADTLLVTGGHDQPCSALGAGAIDPGVAVYATGTVDCITPAFDTPVFSDELRRHNLCTYDHAAPGLYATVAFSLTGGNILKWFRDEFGYQEIEEGKKRGMNPYDVLVEKAGVTPSGLLVLPYFTPSGTPYFDANAKGAIFGLDLSTNRGKMIRGLLEGVAMEIRLNIDILEKSGNEIDELRVIGGGAKSDAWNQLKADVTGKTITVLSVKEAGCQGVAALAKAAISGEDAGKIAEQWVKPEAVKKPNHGTSAYYSEQFLTYRQLYPVLKNLIF